MRPARILVAQIAFAALATASAAAQGPGAIASTRVTVVVPERRTPARASVDAGDGLAPSSGTGAAFGVVGRSDALPCAATLDLGAIGRASVSCLETVDPAAGSPGVAIELESGPLGEGRNQPLVVEVTLDDGAVLRLAARPWRRAGRDIQRIAAPAVAFRRIAASRRITIHVAGESHALSGDARAALRALLPRLGP